ncbi:hypothetical protein POM88_051094 [Heracleum sosnowskyi]|uniref:Uncharacterized protein n=1 Tax=Heracleum sosnowskyi TaxID=360622 RepID=A0AAD8H1A0_9APIA|nr:hypothetical protein POM88_051094 [Heracleum sosnowskyi]
MNIVNYDSNDISFGFYNNVISIFHESKEGALWMTSFQKFSMKPNNPKVHFTLDFSGWSTKVDNSTVKAIREKIANNYGAVKFVVQFKAHKPLIWLENSLERLWSMLFAGAFAGIFVSLCLHPVDTIKTVTQSCRSDPKSILDISRSIIADRGVTGLYRGIASNIAASAPISAVYTFT